jgi:hypothetical protein
VRCFTSGKAMVATMKVHSSRLWQNHAVLLHQHWNTDCLTFCIMGAWWFCTTARILFSVANKNSVYYHSKLGMRQSRHKGSELIPWALKHTILWVAITVKCGHLQNNICNP